MTVERKVTWDELTSLEPRLEVLYQAAKIAGAGHICFCAMQAWDGPDWQSPTFKERLTELVGWFRYSLLDTPEQQILSTARAYEVAYNTVLQALPSCRKCSGHQTEEYLDLRDAGEDVDDWC